MLGHSPDGGSMSGGGAESLALCLGEHARPSAPDDVIAFVITAINGARPARCQRAHSLRVSSGLKEDDYRKALAVWDD
ncbi:hypothetical protein EVAR_96098_1 [Eumeta japonica]|uniref:Uncharacterized protein n=1 Tax=Eumeta variegata TaxID=151549 RepID=A0A4C1VF02_EUMVA|nr:hypothetical protein EVAR_96098_1 [Eumeta japonica]